MYLRNMHVKKVFKSYPKLVILELDMNKCMILPVSLYGLNLHASHVEIEHM